MGKYSDEIWRKVYDIYVQLNRTDKFLSLDESLQDRIIFSQLPKLVKMSIELEQELSFEDIESRISERGYNRTRRLDLYEVELEEKVPLDVEAFKAEVELHMSGKPVYRKQKSFEIEG